MTDNYLSFNYNNPNFTKTGFNNKLSDFNGFIINEGNDLKFFNPSNFSHEFMTPQFGKQSYFLGTTRENREFNFSVLLRGITFDTYREFLRWLNPEEEGVLSFDYSPNYGYDVKVNSISEATFYVMPNCDTSNPTYDIELEVGFITKNDWAARWIKAGNDPLFLITQDGDTNTYTYTNNHNLQNYLIIPFTNALNIWDNDGILIVSIGLGAGVSGTYYSQYGICITENNEFASGTITKIIFEPMSSIILTITPTNVVIPTSREII